MNTEKLLKALDNENNEVLFNYTTKKLKDLNLKILKEFDLSDDERESLMNKLIEYRYIDEMNEFKCGTYIRWICLNNSESIKLKNGGVLCDIKVTDKGVYIVCKGITNKYFQLKMDDCLIFQKLTDQEKVLLSALDHLSK